MLLKIQASFFTKEVALNIAQAEEVRSLHCLMGTNNRKIEAHQKEISGIKVKVKNLEVENSDIVKRFESGEFND